MIPRVFRKLSLHRLLIIAAITLAAALPMLAFSHGVAYSDSVSDLHIDPIQYVGQLLYAWTPKYFLGMHTGFMQGYLTPYSFAYVVLALLHVPPDFSQGAVMFAIYACIIASTYVSLRYIAPKMNRQGRFTAGLAACWNIYVAFNSHGSSVMLLPYAVMPALVAVYAAFFDGRIRIFAAAAIIVGLSLLAGGVNPPLLAIDAVVVVFFIAAALLTAPQPVIVLSQALALSATAAVFVLIVNLYWLLPFIDYFHTVWLGGVLSESTAMHNAATSFTNTLRGFGQWAIFVGDDTGPYYAWAPSFEGLTPYTLATWAVLLLAICSLPFRSNRGRSRVFFLLCLVCGLPLVVGYYSGPIGTAITTPVYAFLFTKIPYFQIFRSVYKWESVVVFSVACLLGQFTSAVLQRAVADRRFRPAMRALAALPAAAVALAFLPVLVARMNPTQLPLPAWVLEERNTLAADDSHRAALMPSQYLEQFYWGDPTYYVESAIAQQALVFGYLGSAPYEDSDQWLRRAYREARSGDPEAAEVFRQLAVSRLLSRDDFRSFEDFAFPETTLTSASLAHDIQTRILGAHPVTRNGANVVYDLSNASPLVTLARRALVSGVPADVVAATYDAATMNRGTAVINPSRLSLSEVTALIRTGTVREVDGGALGLTATLLLPAYPHSYARDGDAEISIPKSASYQLLVHALQPIPGKSISVRIDGGARYRCLISDAQWLNCGRLFFAAGAHDILAGEMQLFGIDALAIPVDAWSKELHQVRESLDGSLQLRVRDGVETYVQRAWSSARMQSTASLLRPAATIYPSGEQKPVPGDVLVLPDAGVIASSAFRMPEPIYEDAATYSFNRGNMQQWWVCNKHAQFRVYSPGHAALRARMTLPIALFAASTRIRLRVNGELQATTALRPAGAIPAGGSLTAMIAPPQQVNASFWLRPGVNVVSLDFSGDGVALEPSPELPLRDPHAMAAMPSLPQVAVDDVRAAAHAVMPDVQIRQVTLPSIRLWGDPALSGVTGAAQKVRRFLVLSTRTGARVHTAVSEIVTPNTVFSQKLADMLPNSYSDRDVKIVGLWLVISPHTVKRPAMTGALQYMYTMRTFSPVSAVPFAAHPHADHVTAMLTQRHPVQMFALAPHVWRNDRLQRLEVRSSGDVVPDLSLQYFDGRYWHLAGDIQPLTPRKSSDRRSWSIDVALDSAVTLDDLSSGRVSVETCGAPLRLSTRLGRDTFVARIDAESARVSSITVARCRSRHVILIDGRSDDRFPGVLSLSGGLSRASGLPMRIIARVADGGLPSGPVVIYRPKALESSDALPAPPAGLLGRAYDALETRRVSPVTVEVRARRSMRNAILVFRESYHPMWRATLDGRVLRHVEVNGFANGWVVPSMRKGQRLILDFTGQRRFIAASYSSLLALCIILAMAIWEIKRGKLSHER